MSGGVSVSSSRRGGGPAESHFSFLRFQQTLDWSSKTEREFGAAAVTSQLHFASLVASEMDWGGELTISDELNEAMRRLGPSLKLPQVKARPCFALSLLCFRLLRPLLFCCLLISQMRLWRAFLEFF